VPARANIGLLIAKARGGITFFGSAITQRSSSIPISGRHITRGADRVATLGSLGAFARSDPSRTRGFGMHVRIGTGQQTGVRGSLVEIRAVLVAVAQRLIAIRTGLVVIATALVMIRRLNVSIA
jgi:hypothetical protein